MSIDTGRERIDEQRRPRRTPVRLAPGAEPGRVQPPSIDSPSQTAADPDAAMEKNISQPPAEKAAAARGAPGFPIRLGRLKYYGLALLLVGAAALLHGTLHDALHPTPFLVFYLAWVGAAAFGGLGPGLLATVVSWLCVELLFPYAPGDLGFANPASIGRLLLFLAGGLVVSIVGETMRRSRIPERQQGRELADANAARGESEFHLAQAQQIAHLGSWSCDFTEDRLFWSDETYRIYGLQPGESVPRHEDFLGFVHPEDRPRVEQSVQEALAHGGCWWLDFRIIQRGGQERYVHCEAQVAFDTEGHPVKAEGAIQDITERKRAEAALRESEQWYRGIVEDQTELICLFEGDTTIVFVNDAYCRYFGKKREELIGHKFLPLIAAEDRDSVQARLAALSPETPVVTIEQRAARPDGSIAWQEWKNRAVFDEQGRLRGYQAVGRDITERKQAQEVLAESRQKYRGLVEKINDWVWEIDADGVYTYASPRARELLGYAPEEIVGKTPFDLMPPAEAQRVREAFCPLWLERKPLELFENTLVRKDGRLVSVETSGMPVFAEDGSFLGYTGIDRDVTARKQAEEALRASQSMLQSVMDSVPQAIFWKDRHSTYLGCNHVFAKAAGLESAAEIVGKTDDDLPWSPEQAALYREYDRRIMDNDAPQYHIIERLREANGKLLWVETNKVPLHDAQGRVMGVLGTYADITESKKYEEALREWNATLESRVARRTRELEHRARQLQKLTLELTETEERERKRLAEILHDDLQQVLAAAKFQVGLLNARVSSDPEFRDIAREARGLLVDAIARSRSLSHELSSPAVSTSDLGEAFESLAAQMHKKHGFTVHLEMNGRLELASEPLRVLLYKVAQELLFNAIKHAGVHEAKLRVRRQRGCLRLSVSDQGRGFDPAEPGCELGFGLLSIRERIGCLGGRLKIRSVVGRGSTFLITVPDPDAGAAAVTPTAATADGASTGTNQS